MTRLIPGEKLDEATRKRIRDLIRAVAGDVSHVGSQLAGERVKVLAPEGVVTVELIAFVDRVLGLAIPRCARCLDVSIGLCNPCRPEHAAELAAAVRGEAPAPGPSEDLVAPAPPPPSEPAAAPARDTSDFDPVRSCRSKHAYPSEVDAKHRARRIFEERGVRLRAYHCDIEGGCSMWHLTKQIGRAS